MTNQQLQRAVRRVGPALKRLKKMMYISPAVTVFSVILLMWVYRSESNVQSLLSFYQRTSHTTNTMQHQLNPTPQHSAPNLTLEPELSLIPVNGTKTLLISAYMEHRLPNNRQVIRRRGSSVLSGVQELRRNSCDTSFHLQVRLIAVVLRSEALAYHCLLCCQEQLHVSEGHYSIHTDHFNFKYGTADIMCPILPACQSPSHVAVTSAGEAMPDEAASQCGEKLDERFMEVKNKEAKTDSFKYKFTVCISTMFDFTNVLQLVQSLEMMKLLGVNRVVVYKTNCSPETQRLLDHYTQQGFLEVFSWPLSRYVNVSRGWLPSHGPGEIHYLGQIPVLNDCVYRYMYKTEYMALQDIDELILPQKVNSWWALRPLLEATYGNAQCYMFENNVFPITVALPPPASETVPPRGMWVNVSGINILDHLYQEPIIQETHYSNFKIIINPRTIFSTTVHGVLSSQTNCVWVDRNIARMYHTRNPRQPKLTPNQLTYDGRLLKYSAALLPAVNTALRESNLLP